MLEDKDVLKVCYYWAKRLKRPGIEFDELVSIGYLHGKPLDNPKLLQKWVMYKMLQFINKEFTHRAASVQDDMLEAMGPLVRGLEYQDCGLWPDNTAEVSEDVYAMLNDADIEGIGTKQSALYGHSKDVLVMRYWESMKLKDIAKHFGVTHQSVGVRLDAILQRLKKVYERRMK